MNAMLDTPKAAEAFEAFEDAGFVKAEAETLAITIAEAMSNTREDLVTKDFLRGELAEFRSEFRGELAALRGEFKADIANSKNEMIRWFLGSQVMLIVILVALTNFTKLVG